jgi:isopentenyl diphosphate isomerase/L-lactate dehydrogenase-like FMN-dependent dehydrogenase
MPRVDPASAVSLADFEPLARAVMDPAAFDYVAGGAWDELSLEENVAAWRRRRFRPRVLVDVGEVTTATTVLGTPVSMPLLVAPFAMQRLLDPEGEVATARATAAAETVMCVSTITSSSHEEIAAAGPGPRWLQLYVLRDRQRTLDHVAEARESGYSALALTVDTPVLGRRERDLRLGFELPADLPLPYVKGKDPTVAMTFAEQFQMSPSVTWRELEWIASESGLPVVLKGIVTREDATLAVEHGAAAVWVSNHGGRQLDGAPATLDALPEVVEAVGGMCEVYVDGGIRRGGDVLKALALGARAAFDPRANAPKEVLAELRGHGSKLFGTSYPKTDIFIEASGAAGLLSDIATFCDKGSRIITLAVQSTPVTLDGTKLMSKELSLLGSSGYPSEFPEVMQKLASGMLDPELMITHRFAFADFLHAFETASDASCAAKVLLQFD